MHLTHYTLLFIKDLPAVGSEVTSDVESEWSEPPLKKSKLQELKAEEEVDVMVSACIH